MKLREIQKILKAELVRSEEDSLEIEVISACASDLMSDVLAFAEPGNLLISGLTNPQVVRTADMVESPAICFVRGKQPVEPTVNLAREEGMPLLCTKLSMYEACGLLYNNGLPDCLEVNKKQ